MSSLQSYLALIDPMLFVILKSIRRTFETCRSVEWAIGGDIAMYLYSYVSDMPAVALDTRLLDLRVKVNEVKDVFHLDGLVAELLKLGFRKQGKSELVYPLSSIRITITEVKDLSVVRMRNAKGKPTYPLLQAEMLMDEKSEYLKKLPLREREVELEVYGWMKEVMNHLVIE